MHRQSIMFHNRISRLADYATDYSNVFAAAGHTSTTATSQCFHGSQGGSTVIVTWTTLATWQQELYRMAYEQALLDTAPPRHERLIAWN